MKKIFFQRLMIAGTALMLHVYSPAQTSHTPSPFVIADAGTHSKLLADMKAKNTKTFNHFTSTYPEAIVNKVTGEKDGTHIRAMINGNSLKVRYDHKGRFQNSVLTYPCSELKEQVADQIMHAYPGFTIFGTVIEVTVRDKSAQLVMIENRNSWRRIRLTKDGIEVYEDYVKSIQ